MKACLTYLGLFTICLGISGGCFWGDLLPDKLKPIFNADTSTLASDTIKISEGPLQLAVTAEAGVGIPRGDPRSAPSLRFFVKITSFKECRLDTSGLYLIDGSNEIMKPTSMDLNKNELQQNPVTLQPGDTCRLEFRFSYPHVRRIPLPVELTIDSIHVLESDTFVSFKHMKFDRP